MGSVSIDAQVDQVKSRKRNAILIREIPSQIGGEALLEAGLPAIFWSALLLAPSEDSLPKVEFPYDGGRAKVRYDPTITRASVPVYRNGTRLRDAARPQPDGFNVLEIFEKAKDRDSWPQIYADLMASTYVRLAYLKDDGKGGALGTSVVGSPSFRLPKVPGREDEFKLTPTVTRADLATGGPDRIHVKLSAQFGTAADVTSVRTYPKPEVGRTTAELSVQFVAREKISLDRGALHNDAFRLLTVSSMFSSHDT